MARRGKVDGQGPKGRGSSRFGLARAGWEMRVATDIVTDLCPGLCILEKPA